MFLMRLLPHLRTCWVKYNSFMSASQDSSERLAKRIARAGVCSRRDAEKLILEGKVSVDGVRILSPALNVSESNHIKVNGKPLPEKEETRIWLYHKPAGLVTSHRDEKGRETLFSALPPELPRVISVGRLDINSEGLLLLTNDGALARHLELPATGWLRRYRVRAHGAISDSMVEALRKGVEVEGVRYFPAEAVLDSQRGENSWLTVSLREGKNREIRKLFEHFGCKVNRLIRVSYGPFNLGNLPRGQVKEVPKKIWKHFLPKAG